MGPWEWTSYWFLRKPMEELEKPRVCAQTHHLPDLHSECLPDSKRADDRAWLLGTSRTSIATALISRARTLALDSLFIRGAHTSLGAAGLTKHDSELRRCQNITQVNTSWLCDQENGEGSKEGIQGALLWTKALARLVSTFCFEAKVPAPSLPHVSKILLKCVLCQFRACTQVLRCGPTWMTLYKQYYTNL
jgi:hypothetical protein